MEGAGIKIVEKLDYFSDATALAKLQALNAKFRVPFLLQSHFVATVDERLVLAGHVPRALVKELLSLPASSFPGKILIYQDRMEERPRTYRLWAFQGESREFPIETPIETALASILPSKVLSAPGFKRQSLILPTVLAAGLLDGLSPCAFAVLIFLVAFLFAVRKLRRDVFRVGAVFIAAVLITYFMIGAGLLKALSALSQFHIIGQLGAYLLILLGVLTLLKWAFPRFPVALSLPGIGWDRIRMWIQRATYPSASVAGFLVGFCTLPCSGGIYLATLALLAANTTYLKGLAFLSIYNLANVVPLVVILLATTNRAASLYMARWEQSLSRSWKGIFGALEVTLGVLVLIWVV